MEENPVDTEETLEAVMEETSAAMEISEVDMEVAILGVGTGETSVVTETLAAMETSEAVMEVVTSGVDMEDQATILEAREAREATVSSVNHRAAQVTDLAAASLTVAMLMEASLLLILLARWADTNGKLILTEASS
jgi:hypothetical protein